MPENASSLHAVVDTPLRGESAKWGMATITSGHNEGDSVCVLVEFSDGHCVCDMGKNKPLRIIHRDRLRFWIAVRGVVNRDGKTFIDPL